MSGRAWELFDRPATGRNDSRAARRQSNDDTELTRCASLNEAYCMHPYSEISSRGLLLRMTTRKLTQQLPLLIKGEVPPKPPGRSGTSPRQLEAFPGLKRLACFFAVSLAAEH